MSKVKSFSALTKETLASLEPKKKCCKRVYAETVNSLDKSKTGEMSTSEVFGKFKCDNCLKEFLRGAFVASGSVTDPEKRYHLDFTFEDYSDAEIVSEALESAGFEPKTTMRREKHVVYFKDNDMIGDFLAYIGANKAAFDMMNSKIVKDVRNNANRLVNCDTANIEKAIAASQKYVEAIKYIEEVGAMSSMPGELREAAELRVKFIQAPLSELASKCQIPITKSGMKHRLEKILKYAEDLKSR